MATIGQLRQFGAGSGAGRVTVYDSRIQGMFLPGGDTWNFARSIKNMTIEFAERDAPERSGLLADSHRGSVTPIGKYACTAVVRNDADYALYVHEGTRAIIASDRVTFDSRTGRTTPGRMIVPESEGSEIYIFMRYVRGQKANPWLARAGRAATNTIITRAKLSGAGRIDTGSIRPR